MRFSVLGRLQVISDDGAELRIVQPRQRALLAVLLLHANQEMSVSRLVESLWEQDGPAAGAGALRTQVWALRRLLVPARRLHTGENRSYRLEVRPGELDAARFRQLAGQGRDAFGSGDLPGAVISLKQALALWGEPSLADVPATLAMRPVAQRLLDEHATARELLTEARLSLGQHADLIPELRECTSADPANERLWEQLMLALHGVGRTAEALAAYQQARTTMQAELGLEPGHALQQLHRRILAGDPERGQHGSSPAAGQPAAGSRPRAETPFVMLQHPAPARPGPPRQLPPPVPGFVGRAAELHELTVLLEAWVAADGATMIAAISGAAGVGKTALAVYWAHRVAASFPDGQLYLNLNGFGPAGLPLTQEDAVSRVLEALQVPSATIPSSLEGRIGLYRTLLSERRMLIVLDNAKNAEQVRPLLPGGAGNLVLVTSRSALASLAALEGARTITLTEFTEPEARQMVAQRLGPGRTAADPAANGQLIDACSRLPLALAIATALIATRPAQSLATVVSNLRRASSRLDILNTGEATANLRAVFYWSYQALTRDSARTFRLLAEHPGPDISVAAAAGLTGLPLARAGEALTELSDLHLIDEHVSGRFAFHDLLRLYAAEMLGTLDSAAERRAAGQRLLDHYLHTARTAAQAISPKRNALDLKPGVAGASPGDLADSGEAVAWLEAEHQVLMRVIGYAADHRFDVHAWQLPWTLTDFLERGGHWPDFAASQRIALTAAIRIGDVTAQAYTHQYIGRACFDLQDMDGALQHFAQAIELRRQLGESAREAGIFIDLSNVHEQRGDVDEALSCAQRALGLYQSVSHRVGEAHALNAVGYYCARRQDYSEALTHCRRALELCGELNYLAGKGYTWHSLGFIRQHMGQPAQAIACYTRALDVHRRLMDRFHESEALIGLGDTCHGAGDRQGARQAWRDALVILDDLGHPDGDKLRAKIAGTRKVP